MATVVFSRGKRATPPPMPRGDLLRESPPELPPPAAKQTFGAVLRFLPMVAGALAMGIIYSGRAQGGTKLGMGAISGGLMGVSMVGMMISQMGRGNNDESQELDASRRDYFRYLGQTRRQVRMTAADQRKAVTWRHPAPDTLELGSVIGGLAKKSWTPPVLAFDAGHVPVVLPPEADLVPELKRYGAGVRIAVVDTAAQINVSPYLRGGIEPIGAKPTWQTFNYAGDELQVTADPPPGAVPDAQLGHGIVNPTRAVFGPFAETATTPTPRASASAGPLVIPPERDTRGMLVAVVVTLGVLVLLFGALLIGEALGPMRARTYAPARPGE